MQFFVLVILALATATVNANPFHVRRSDLLASKGSKKLKEDFKYWQMTGYESADCSGSKDYIDGAVGDCVCMTVTECDEDTPYIKVSECDGTTNKLAFYGDSKCTEEYFDFEFSTGDTCNIISESNSGFELSYKMACSNTDYSPSEDDEKTCFAGSETVQLENGEIKVISEVIVGDRILAADMDGVTKFSSVVALAHPKNNIASTFVHVETVSMDVKVTPEHLLMASADCSAMKLTKASDVSVDSCILTVDGPARVTAISQVVQQGIYSVVTEKELIVVNGVIASPFAVNHEIASRYYDIYRLFPSALVFKAFETIHFGISAFVQSF